jgi:hypothetical protein
MSGLRDILRTTSMLGDIVKLGLLGWTLIILFSDKDVFKMVDISTFAPPTEYLYVMLFLTIIVAGLGAYMQSRKSFQNVIKKNLREELEKKEAGEPYSEVSTKYDPRYIAGTIIAVILSVICSVYIAGTVFSLLEIQGAEAFAYAIVSAIVGFVLSRWFVIAVHEGVDAVFTDMDKIKGYAKELGDKVGNGPKLP